MTENTLQLISQFSPKPINIPINKFELEQVLDTLINLMFPICNCPDNKPVQESLKDAAKKLHANIAKLHNLDSADEKTEAFFKQYSALQDQLFKDANCYLQNDPAAKSLEEVIITYPGFYALCAYRIAHSLYKMGLPLISRLFTEYAHAKVGIDIHPAAKIGKNFFMDHGTGIVIGETTEIGDNVKIYQGVTLGALYVEKKLSNTKRHPTVEDNVVIYANATILGGETVIGHDSIIMVVLGLHKASSLFSCIQFC